MDPQAWFAKGQTALQAGDLDAAEAAFHEVLEADPGAGSAYANLGVIAMRRKNWDEAIRLLRKAETLEPKMAGIRLNIGLVEYRRGNYAAALPAGTLPSLHEEICGGRDNARTVVAGKVQ
jgi:Flp pilus assembly protein TadD